LALSGLTAMAVSFLAKENFRRPALTGRSKTEPLTDPQNQGS